ncbi:MAG TPA: AarF/UbiB family protein [Myxococcota bacterium]|nr:AarF/UbiB family protein [Myxococcota bacterium]
MEPDRMPWRARIQALRAETAAKLPEMVRARGLPPLDRFAGAGLRLGAALATWAALERRRAQPLARAALSRRLRRAFEQLGPAYIKLGQIVSSGRGLFPDEVVEEFSALRDRVPPEPFSAVKAVVEEDLGRRLEDVFASFEPDSLAAASIAQVHAARLRSGEDVVVKVQRPQVARLVRADLRAMAWIAPFLVGRIPVAALANPPALVELFAETISEELDFRLEAENMLDIARLLLEAGQSVVVVPRPHPELVTRRVLVMERLQGYTIAQAAEMRAAGIDTAAVLRALLIAFLEGAMIHGVFHGDLHAGNLFVMPDGRVALLDFGMTGRMTVRQRQAFLRMMVTGFTNDMPSHLAAYRDLGALPDDADIDAIIRDLRIDKPPVDPTQLTGEELVAEIQEVLKHLLAHGARLPKHLMLYVKDLIFIDGAIGELAPDVDLFGEVGRIFAYFTLTHGERIARELGGPSFANLDLTAFKASLGLRNDVETLTHRELLKRRETVRKRLEDAGGPRL